MKEKIKVFYAKPQYGTSIICLHCGSVVDARELKYKRDNDITCPICRKDICNGD